MSTELMNPLLKEVRHNPMLWLLAFVPVVFAAAKLEPEAHTLLFVLSVLAIVPLAALLSHATESVAAKTGDAAGGLLNATLGNLTELVIALTALHELNKVGVRTWPPSNNRLRALRRHSGCVRSICGCGRSRAPPSAAEASRRARGQTR